MYLVISTENAAFEGDNLAPEVARILKMVAYQIEEQGAISGAVLDINGNRCGNFDINEPGP